jgi:hypothetical protein
MSDMRKTNLVLLSSKKLNEKDTFESYKEDIYRIVNGFDPANYQFTVGKIHNGSLIAYVKSLGYEVNEVGQHLNSLYNSNKKLIRESEGAIFFIYNKSSIMMKLLEYANSCKLTAVVPVYFNTTKQNATYLFRAKNGFSHSESRWNAIMQLSIIWMGKNNKRLDAYYSSYESKKSDRWLSKVERLSFKGWNSHNTIVEGKLNNRLFHIDKWHKDFDNLSPDIVHIDQENKKVVIIEIKALSSSVKQNMTLYKRLQKSLGDSGKWECELYYLLSYGHETISDWSVLKESRVKILLWEELFSKMKDSDIAPYIDEHLEHYTLMPNWLKSTEDNEVV